MGNVRQIAARATTVVTNDNIAIIVPNSDFITQRVTNWSYGTPVVRLRIPVGVSYASDPEVVRRILVEVAERHEGVLGEPKPDVMFAEFGESSLNFELRVGWTRAGRLPPDSSRERGGGFTVGRELPHMAPRRARS